MAGSYAAYKEEMKYISIKICLVITSLFVGVAAAAVGGVAAAAAVGGITAASDLPDCTEIFWHNCFGTNTLPSGAKYIGEWKDGKRTGQGTLTWATGAEYVGEWKGDKRTGQGTYTWASGNKYIGEFKDGKTTGQGTSIWNDGTEYVGERKDGKKTGQGTYTWPNGDKYIGEFKDDKRTGQGTLIAADGSKYIGEFMRGKFDGKGTLIDVEGKVGEGTWKDNELDGHGTLTWANGDKYVGEFKGGEKIGKGTLTWANGNKYVGEWKDSHLNGKGTKTWVNGDKYVGEWKDNLINGKGTFTSANGTVSEGIWKDSEFLGTIAELEIAEKKRIAKEKQEELVSVAGASDLPDNVCDFGDAAEILNQTHGLYGSLFTGGNHGQSLSSSAGSADLYRLLKSKGDLGYRNNASVYNHSFDNTRTHDGFNWILEFSKTHSNDWYASAFVDADLNNVVDQTIDPWIPLGAKKDGKEFLTWLSFTIKSSAAPWNYMPMYIDQYQLLWNVKYSPTFTQIMQRYTQSKDLAWYVLATELALPRLSYPELETRYKELAEKVSECEADSAEYAAWALSSLKFEQSDLTPLQVKFLPDQLLVNKTVSSTRKLAHELALDFELQSNRETLENLSAKLPAQAVSLYPILTLLYLTPQDKLADVVSKITSSKNPTSELVQRITYNHLSKRLNSASTDVIEQIYNAVHDNSVTLKSRLRGVLAARYFLDSEYDKSLTMMADIIMEADQTGAKSTASYGMTYIEHFLADIPIEAKTASLVLALHSVSNWPSYYNNCFHCLKSKKDIPKWMVSETQHKKDNEIYLKKLLGDPQLADWIDSLQGGRDAEDAPLDRARNSDREDIRGDSWYENKRYSLAPYQLQQATYEDMTPIMNKSAEIILKWAAEKSWLPWSSDPAKIHKAAALNALIYASKTNPSVGLIQNPSRQAWLLIEENFLEFKHFKYWYAPSNENYIKNVKSSVGGDGD